MTDREKLLALLDEWGVPYCDEGATVKVGNGADMPASCSMFHSPKISGYDGFYVSFDFDGSDRFMKIGCWE